MKEKLLFLAQRIPFPPDKGDKITTFNILKHLAKEYDVVLGAFADDPDDIQHVETLRIYCEDLLILPLNQRWAKIRSLKGILTNEALTIGYFNDAAMKRWIDSAFKKHSFQKVLIYSSAMAQYIFDSNFRDKIIVAHYADIDSDKWLQYASMKSGIMRRVYQREARTLLKFEIEAGNRCKAVSFVAQHEVDHFRKLAPHMVERIHVVANGTDSDYFDPALNHENPFPSGVFPIVFTGAMDYFPNADAVTWFAQSILPLIIKAVPNAVFYIVGSKPSDVVLALANEKDVFVTGRVPDVRPYLRNSRAVVAPLRAARGVQNKALEALSMGCPVVCTSSVSRGLSEHVANLVDVADTEEDFAQKTAFHLTTVSPNSAAIERRNALIANYGWTSNLKILDQLLTN